MALVVLLGCTTKSACGNDPTLVQQVCGGKLVNEKMNGSSLVLFGSVHSIIGARLHCAFLLRKKLLLWVATN